MTAKAKRSNARQANGTSLLEVPAMLWILFIVMLGPMIGMATVSLKSSLLNAATQDGAQAASKAKTFSVGTTEKPAATVVGEKAIRTTAALFSGLNVESVTTEIVVTPVAGGRSTRFTGKLPAPADTSQNIYQIETVAKGKIDPLVLFNPHIVGKIPGVSEPIQISFVARQMSENPQGLNQ